MTILERSLHLILVFNTKLLSVHIYYEKEIQLVCLRPRDF